MLTTAKYFIPRLLGRFCAELPGVEPSLSVGNRKALLKRLAQKLDDLYIPGADARTSDGADPWLADFLFNHNATGNISQLTW